MTQHQKDNTFTHFLAFSTASAHSLELVDPAMRPVTPPPKDFANVSALKVAELILPALCSRKTRVETLRSEREVVKLRLELIFVTRQTKECQGRATVAQNIVEG